MALMATQKASRTPPMAVEAVAPPGRDKKLAALMAPPGGKQGVPKGGESWGALHEGRWEREACMVGLMVLLLLGIR